MRLRRLLSRRLAVLLVGWVLVVPVVAGAHAQLVKSAPARRAALARSPERVQLWFNEALEPSFARLTVVDAGGARVDEGDASVEPDDPKALSVKVRALEPGTYTVKFRVLSVDGHVVESDFPFTVRPRR
jgi:methionine-rich copper-binding protein CopC